MKEPSYWMKKYVVFMMSTYLRENNLLASTIHLPIWPLVISWAVWSLERCSRTIPNTGMNSTRRSYLIAIWISPSNLLLGSLHVSPKCTTPACLLVMIWRRDPCPVCLQPTSPVVVSLLIIKEKPIFKSMFLIFFLEGLVCTASVKWVVPVFMVPIVSLRHLCWKDWLGVISVAWTLVMKSKYKIM